MSTQSVAVRSTPVDIVATLSLTNGQTYLLQVVGRRAVRFAEAAAAPADRGDSHLVLPGFTWAVRIGAEPLWFWCDDPAGSRAAATES